MATATARAASADFHDLARGHVDQHAEVAAGGLHILLDLGNVLQAIVRVRSFVTLPVEDGDKFAISDRQSVRSARQEDAVTLVRPNRNFGDKIGRQRASCG